MNKHRFLLLSLFFAFLFSGCDDFLERNPTGQAVSETFWKSEKDVTAALMGVYSRLYTAPFNQPFRVEVLSDNARPSQTWETEYRDILLGIITPTTGGPVSSWYSSMYTGIASCNYFLENVDRVPEIDQNLKNRYIGEVKFLRAWFYFQLQQTYGGVIVYEKMPIVDEAKIKQRTSEEVVSFIISDLDEAIPYLPDSKYSGRVVKNTALALKAKTLLHAGQWSAAAGAAQQVIASGNCSLYPDYRGLFLREAQQSNPDEILFSSVYTLPNRYHTNGYFYINGYTAPRQELLDAYLCIDGLPISESPLFDPDDPYQNRDPRLLLTNNTTGIRIVNGQEYLNTNTWTGFFWRKCLEDDLVYFNQTLDRDDNDLIHLRYADVLLMYAEAQNEVSGPDASVYSALNTIRDRAGMPHVQEGLSKEAMREMIRLERRVELAGEGNRWYDIRRWGIANEVLSAVDEPGGGPGTLKMLPHQYVWPFPQTEIDLNPNLVQNPGYN